MNGRKRIELHAFGEQPRRRWELVERRDQADVYDRQDGYRVYVWFTTADAVNHAQLVSPSGTNCGLPWGRRGRKTGGKADQVIDWIADPTAYLRPPAGRCARCGDAIEHNGRGELVHSARMNHAYDHSAEEYPSPPATKLSLEP